MLIAVIQVGAIAAFLGLGWVAPRRAEGLFHRDTWLNVGTGLLLVTLKVALLAEVAVVTGAGAIPLGSLPEVLQLGLAFLLLDVLKWGLHFADHRISWLWMFHRVHHSSVRLNATSGLRMHVVDFVKLAFVPVLVFSVLLDVRQSPAWLIPATLAPGAILDAFQHGNLRFPHTHPLWRTWDQVLNNPHFHAWHHTAEGSLVDGNYGNVLTIWDRLFGTCVSREMWPEALGLEPSEALADDLVGMHLLRRPAR